jgi:protein SCO1/2
MRDLAAKPILWAAVAIAATVAVVIVAVLVSLGVGDVSPRGDRFRFGHASPAEAPGLASAPQDQLARERRDKEAWLHSAGAAHIPIEEAMDRLVTSQPRAALEQHIGARLPLELRVVDHSGAPHRLADYFADGRSVLLVPGYYRCPQLCGLVMHAVLESLKRSGVAGDRWRIVAFSIDAKETTADAHARRDADLAYSRFLAMPEPDLHLLTLEAADARRLARLIGYAFENQPAQIAHPASIVVVTPHGTVSRYFNGVQFDAPELRVALADAAGDRVGGVTSRLALLCAHFDPHAGRWTAVVMNAVRVICALLVLSLGAWCWRRRRGTSR